MCLALRASGLWLRCATLQNLIPSFPWIAPPRPPLRRNPRKGRDQILPPGNHGCTRQRRRSRPSRTTLPSSLPNSRRRQLERRRIPQGTKKAREFPDFLNMGTKICTVCLCCKLFCPTCKKTDHTSRRTLYCNWLLLLLLTKFPFSAIKMWP